MASMNVLSLLTVALASVGSAAAITEDKVGKVGDPSPVFFVAPAEGRKGLKSRKLLSMNWTGCRHMGDNVIKCNWIAQAQATMEEPTRPPPPPPPPPPMETPPAEEPMLISDGGGSCDDPLVAAMVGKHNEYRGNGGMTGLGCNDGGSFAAYEWTKEMCRYGEPMGQGTSHANMDVTRKAAGFDMKWAENNLYNVMDRSDTVDTGFQQWVDSPTHHKNLVGDYQEVGCGYYDCTDRGRIYWTCIYGSKM